MLFFSFLFSTLLFSSIHAQAQTNLEDLLTPLGGKGKGNACLYSRDEVLSYSMMAGYETMMPYWSCVMLRKHLNRDSKLFCRPSVSQTFLKPKSANERNIKGTISFVGFVPLPYSYEVGSVSNTVPQVQVKVHFTGPAATPTNLALIKARMKTAESIWKKGSLPIRPTSFHFEVVRNASDADFSVRLQEEDTRGPYLKRWSTKWSVNTIAHELGHMMGLDDEYDNMRSTLLGGSKIPYEKLARCSQNSIMCSSNSGTPQPYHYYVILRRNLCH